MGMILRVGVRAVATRGTSVTEGYEGVSSRRIGAGSKEVKFR